MSCSQKRLAYLVAIVASAVVLLTRLALNEALAEQARLLPFVLAVIAAAWLGGLGPGLLATALGFFLGLQFIVPPPNSLLVERFEDALNAGIFLVIGVTISFLCEALHEARRRETEKQFRTLADSMPQLVWMARPDGYRFWFNERWYDYTGATPGLGEGEGWQSFHDPTEIPRVLKSWEAAVATGKPWEETYPLRRKDGQMRWHLSRAVPLRDESGEITCWFGTNTDVQDRIETEKALKDADARKDEFLATLAHELRNPLSPISNALQLWPHVAGDKDELEHLRTVIDRQVQQLVRLIDDLMDVSRITRGKINLRPQRIEVRSLIDRAVETVTPWLKACGHKLTVTIPDDPIWVNGDAVRLTQVFCNILHNAAKYTPFGGTISIAAERKTDRVVVSVRDNGAGIPQHMLSEVFKPFYQVDKTLNRSHGGLGIGLSLARQFVEMHGGTIEAHSEGADKGSEFVVALPVQPAFTSANELAGVANSLSHRTEIGCHRILVVDDLRESADTLAQVLRTMGQDATSLHDGKAAISWILGSPPDAVFLDIAMPGLDGYKVASRLREHEELDKTVLVALTGYGQPEDRRRAFAAGFDFHLTKPSNVGALEDVLLRLPAGRETNKTKAATL